MNRIIVQAKIASKIRYLEMIKEHKKDKAIMEKTFGIVSSLHWADIFLRGGT